MNPQNPTPAEALRKAAHFLRSLRAQSTSEENWQAFEPFAAETLQIVDVALARPPLPSESVALIHREALLGAALDMCANWEGNLSTSMARLNDAIALALDVNEAPDGAPFLEYLANNFSDEAADKAGSELAAGLSLRVSRDHPDRWVTEWGTKTARGLARTLLHVIAQSIAPGAQAAPQTCPTVPARVLVHIEGGIVQGVIADRPVEWLALDTEDFNPRVADDDQAPFAPGGELARLTTSPGAVHVGKFRAATVSPAAIAEIEDL